MHRKTPPTRAFPSASPAGTSGSGTLALTYDQGSSELIGTYGVWPVEWQLKRYDYSTVGRIGDRHFGATWSSGSNYVPQPGEQASSPDYVSDFPNIPAELTGTFGGVDVELRGVFHLDPDYAFERGSILGRIGSVHLEATALAASGGFTDTRTVAVEGTYGTVAFEIYATIDAQMSKGLVRGTVDEATVHLDVTRPTVPHPRLRSGYPGPRVDIAGTYGGPPELLAVVVGSVLRFI